MDNYPDKILGIPREWFVVTCGAFFYCYQFLLRVSPNVMHDELVSDFMMDASLFGTMVAFYFWSYAIVQLPLGVALDRFGAGKLMTIATFICAFSCHLFASTTSFYVASFALFLMGLGSACGFLGSIKLGTIWFPPSHVARVIAIILVFGTIGAGLGGAPLSALTDMIGWQSTMHLLGVIGLSLGIMMYFVIGRYKDPIIYEPTTNILSGLKEILSKPQAWFISLYGMLMYVPINVLGVAWGVPYLLSAYGITEQAAASVITTMFIGAAIGSPVFTYYSDKIKKRSTPMVVGALLALVVNCVILMPNIPLIMMYGLFFLAGFAYTAKSLSFISICEIMPKTSSGVAVGFINTVTMANGAFFLPFIGTMLDFYSKGGVVSQEGVYSHWDYRFALSIIPISIFFSALLVWFIKETHHDSQLTESEKGAALLSDME